MRLENFISRLEITNESIEKLTSKIREVKKFTVLVHVLASENRIQE